MKPKVPTEEIWRLYLEYGSVWKVGTLVGIGGQSVHERLVNHGYKLKNNRFTPEDDEMIRQAYAKSVDEGVDLVALTVALKRSSHQNVCRRARKLGLTNNTRKKSIAHRDIISKNSLQRVQNGFASGNYSKTIKGWHTFSSGKHYYLRSSWERLYGEYLDKLVINGEIVDWEYEPDTFWFEKIRRGTRSYTPDFKVVLPSGDIEYHEVKGYMDKKSITKLKRMRIYHKGIVIKVIAKAEMKALGLL